MSVDISGVTAEGAARPAPAWRRVLPPVLAVGLLAAVLSRVDLAVFVVRLRAVNVPALVAFVVAFGLALLAADTLATVTVYRRLIGPVGYREFYVIRGASCLPSILNHHLGQAMVTWCVAKTQRAPLWRVAGATLVGYASWAGCMVGLGCVALWLAGQPLGWLAALVGAGSLYLAVLAARPAALARREVLAPLFEAGVWGHAVALVARLPHLAVMFLGTWLSFSFFGVHVPLVAAVKYVPLFMLAITLPLTPQGFGTRDALAALLLVPFAPGDTADAKLAAVAAATTTWGVATTLWEAALGLIFMRFATRRVERAGRV